IVPAPLAGLGVEGDQGLGEQGVAVAGDAEPVRLGQFHAGVDEAQLRVAGDWRPDAGVRPRLRLPWRQPGLVAEPALARHGVADPLAPAGAHVEAAQIAQTGAR